MNFEELPLHDASITSISYEWGTKMVSIIGKRYDASIQEISTFKILFKNVSLLSIPHIEKWGSSDCIFEVVALNMSEFKIKMQSGDLIAINAECFIFY